MLVFKDNPEATKIELVSKKQVEQWLESQDNTAKTWAERCKFKGNANHFFTIPDKDNNPGRVVVGIGDKPTIESIGSLPNSLPTDDYQLENVSSEDDLYTFALGWGLGAYKFRTYKKPDEESKASRLFVGCEVESVKDEIQAMTMARDLINTPAGDLLPHNLEESARQLCKKHDVTPVVTIGEELLEAGFRTIHAVGRASVSSPRLIDFSWGDPDHVKVTLLGKGVCFDSGGLDLKTAAGMRSMKKDMGGAAIALGLSHLIMTRKLPIRLRVLVATVENAVSANAYHPGDIIRTYKGTTVEVGNTDAEGRLILCDALALAAEEEPDLMIDFTTLTGAARTAVGPEISAMFSNDDEIAKAIERAADETLDPVWRLPLYDGYRRYLKSSLADMSNIGSENSGGAITAALYLEHFVDSIPWVHFDLLASNPRSRPARPEGGEAMALRATYRYLESTYASVTGT